MNRPRLSRSFSFGVTRRVVALLVVSQVVSASPLLAAALLQSSTTMAQGAVASLERQVQRASTRVRVNRTVPHVTPVSLSTDLPPSPTDAEVARLRLFAEPLVPVGGRGNADANAALSTALQAWIASADRQRVPEMDTFLAEHPTSVWRASLLANLAAGYAHAGYYTRALSYWDQAWTLAKSDESRNGRAVADYAVGQWLEWATKFGQADALSARLAEVAVRPVGGAAAQQVSLAREGLKVLQTLHHQAAIFSGPEALKALIRVQNPRDAASLAIVSAYRPDPTGTSLTQLSALAQSTGLALRMEHRAPTAPVPMPAIVHLRSNHFSMVVRQEGARFLLRDVILGGEVWLDQHALADEASGYYLVPVGAAQAGRAVPDSEADAVVGHCLPGFPSPYDDFWEWIENTALNRRPPGGGGTGDGPKRQSPPGKVRKSGGDDSRPDPSGCGMPVYDFHPLTVSLLIVDVPVTCSTPKGPSTDFRLSYDQREVRQPQTFAYGNVGARWRHNWHAYVLDNIGANVHVYPRGAGMEVHQSFGVAHQYNRTKLLHIAHDPPRYERHFPDGTIEVYAQPDRAASLSFRQVFLTEVIDPQGVKLEFTYDSSLRLVAVEDGLGRVTTLDYELAGDPLKVTKVTDPYGRFATLSYNPAGQLAAITDVIGMSSSFSYGNADFIQSMTTPYGTSTFRTDGGYNTANVRMVEATDPTGATERLEFWYSHDGLATTAPSGEVPTGFSALNVAMNMYTTLFWDSRAMATAPGDVSQATQVRWLYGANAPGVGHAESRLPHSVKWPLESRVWFKYPDQANGLAVGTGSVPTQVARVVDGGATQLWQSTVNDLGHTTAITDPLGRQTTYTYDTNQIDLLEVRQTGNGANDVLAVFADYTSGHQPQTVTDAAGAVTTLTYNTAGQVLTVTNAASQTTTSVYDTDGFLQSVTGPVSGAITTYGYDGYGRVATVTGPDGYAVDLEHDALGRTTKVTYPDGTFEQVTYEKLHVKEQRDRLGRMTTYFHDAAGRPTAVRDAAGRTVQYDWCRCTNLNALIDAKGQRTTWTRDVHGRVTTETRADGSTTTGYTYQPLTGRLATVTDPKAQVTTYTYNLDDTLASTGFTNETIATADLSHTYDTQYARPATMVDGNGTTTYTYKAAGTQGAGQLASVDGPFGSDTITYSYDDLGRVATRLLNGTGTELTYDTLGRLSALEFPIGQFDYTYEGHTGRVATVTYPNAQTSTYSYLGHTGDHRLQTIHHKNPSAATLSKFDYTYDPVGNILTWRQERAGAAAKVYTFAHDAVDQLTSAVLTDTNTTPTILKRQAWAYDPAGNRTVDQHDDAVFATSHDAMNRLQARAPGGPIVLSGTVNEAATLTIDGKPATVDASNNFQGTAQVALGTTTVTLKAKDPTGNEKTQQYEIDAAGSTTSYAYDANGNLTGDGTKTYLWNALNQLVEVKEGSTTIATFEYDGAGRRTEKVAAGVTHVYIYDAEDIVEERLSGSTTDTIRYYHGAGIDEPLARKNSADVMTYYLADHLGSIVQETEADGDVALEREYDPWGNLLQGAGAAGYAFTSREWDAEVGLVFFRSRFYSADLAVFLSDDSIGLSGGINQRNYVANRPEVLVDPLGTQGFAPAMTFGWWVGASVGGPAGGAVGAVTAVTTAAVIGWYGPQIVDSLSNLFSKPPKGAYDPNGAKAPGRPGLEEGFVGVKGGDQWVKNPNGSGNGWLDKRGDVWVPTGKAPGRAHGGPHWDVQTPGRPEDYRNVFPKRTCP